MASRAKVQGSEANHVKRTRSATLRFRFVFYEEATSTYLWEAMEDASLIAVTAEDSYFRDDLRYARSDVRAYWRHALPSIARDGSVVGVYSDEAYTMGRTVRGADEATVRRIHNLTAIRHLMRDDQIEMAGGIHGSVPQSRGPAVLRERRGWLSSIYCQQEIDVGMDCYFPRFLRMGVLCRCWAKLLVNLGAEQDSCPGPGATSGRARGLRGG